MLGPEATLIVQERGFGSPTRARKILAEVSEATKQKKILDADQTNVLAKQGKTRDNLNSQ